MLTLYWLWTLHCPQRTGGTSLFISTGVWSPPRHCRVSDKIILPTSSAGRLFATLHNGCVPLFYSRLKVIFNTTTQFNECFEWALRWALAYLSVPSPSFKEVEHWMVNIPEQLCILLGITENREYFSNPPPCVMVCYYIYHTHYSVWYSMGIFTCALAYSRMSIFSYATVYDHMDILTLVMVYGNVEYH